MPFTRNMVCVLESMDNQLKDSNYNPTASVSSDKTNQTAAQLLCEVWSAFLLLLGYGLTVALGPVDNDLLIHREQARRPRVASRACFEKKNKKNKQKNARSLPSDRRKY